MASVRARKQPVGDVTPLVGVEIAAEGYAAITGAQHDRIIPRRRRVDRNGAFFAVGKLCRCRWPFGVAKMQAEGRGRENDLLLPLAPSNHHAIAEIQRADLDAEKADDGPSALDEHHQAKAAEEHA